MVTSFTEGSSKVRCRQILQEYVAIEKESNAIPSPFVLEWVQEEGCYNGLESNSPVIVEPAKYPEISEPSTNL